MPLVRHYRGRRIWKAKRARSLRGRPAWQTEDPGSKEGRDAYAIAAKYEQTFAKAFLEAIRSQITPEIERDFREAWKTGSPTAVVNSIPFFEDNPDSPMWERFADKLSVAYLTVIQAAGDDATKDLNKQFKTKLEFYALPPPDETETVIEKALRSKCMTCDAAPEVEVIWADGRAKAWFCKTCYADWEKQHDVVPTRPIQKSMADVRQAAAGMTVEVNPYSIDWVRQHGLELVAEGISPGQKQVVTSIIQDTMAVGGRPTNALGAIKENIGLTARDHAATLKRMNLHVESGLSSNAAKGLTDKYRDQLLTKRANLIARTETIKAQAQGRKDAWQVAEDGGQLPPVMRRWMSPPPSSDPNAPCEICLDLDGTTAGLKDPYKSSLIGEVEGPPAHPACRCSESLEKA